MPFIGLFLMLMVHFLPTEKMADNVYSSKSSIISEYSNELVIDEYNATLKGSFTDALMLQYAVYDRGSHSVLQQVMAMYRRESANDGSWWPGISLIDYLNGKQGQTEISYSRYWHGYLVILKPLLLFFSYNSIRLLNTALQCMLFALASAGLAKRGRFRLASAFCAAVPFMFFFSSFASLSLSVCMYIMLIEMVIVSLFHDKLLKDENYLSFFIIFGAVTSFTDFLTYPLVTLAFPLIAALCLKNEKDSKKLIDIVKYSLSWGIGYGFMWASKWVMAALFLGKGAFSDALSTVAARSASSGNGRISGYLSVLKNNFKPYLNRAFALFTFLIVIYVIIMFVKADKKKYLDSVSRSYSLFAVAAFPFVWWFVAANHSAEHWMFTCRIISITVFAILAFALGQETAE